MWKFQFSWVSNSNLWFSLNYSPVSYTRFGSTSKSCEYTKEFDYTPVAYTGQYIYRRIVLQNVHIVQCTISWDKMLTKKSFRVKDGEAADELKAKIEECSGKWIRLDEYYTMLCHGNCYYFFPLPNKRYQFEQVAQKIPLI